MHNQKQTEYTLQTYTPAHVYIGMFMCVCVNNRYMAKGFET